MNLHIYSSYHVVEAVIIKSGLARPITPQATSTPLFPLAIDFGVFPRPRSS
jgi:hypothetical protein